MIKIIQNRNKFFIFSSILAVLSVLSLAVWGLNLGIDFTGGSLLEVQIEGEMELAAQGVSNIIKEKMPEIGEVRAQPTEDGFLIRMKNLSEQEHQKVLNVLKNSFGKEDTDETQSVEANDFALKAADDTDENSKEVADSDGILLPHFLSKVGGQDDIQELRFESIGPVIGQELKSKAIWAVGVALLVIIIFIAWAFRKVSKPVASWKYGIGAIIALAHDVLIVMGIFSVLGHFFLGFEADILFVTALLTILGYSVNDTIVVYDRTRENLIYNPQDTFEATVNKSVNETIGRSVNTGLTTLLVLLTLYFLGGTTIQNFVLALMIGTVIGTYSSIFVASPLLVVWQKLFKKR